MHLTRAGERAVADALLGKASLPTLSHLGLLTVLPTATADGTEASYTGYARITNPAASWAAATTDGSGVTTSKNSAAFSFAQNTGTTQDVLAVGFYTASSGGALVGWLPLDGGALTLANGDSYSAPANALTVEVRGAPTE